MAFGNPNISTNPVNDPYSSQANLYGNSFGNPLNPANTNQGWGINSNLLTPSYTANYRPQYSGSNPTNEYGRMGFFRGMYDLSPVSPDRMWGNPVQHNQQAMESVSGRPADAAMWGVQRIVAPTLAFGAANAFTKATGLGWGAGYKFGSGLGGGIARGMGAAAEGGAIASGINMAARGTLGTAFGAAAYVGVPLAIGQGLMWGAEKTLFDPYMNTRRSSRDLRENFAGVTFGDSQGNSITGGGLSGRESYRMASELTRQGINDMSFSSSQYNQAASYQMRSGLLDNVSSKGMTSRIKENIEQVKLIMSIASMPEVKEATELLAKLQQSGANTAGGMFSNAAGTMRKMGNMASIAGASVQHIMETVGAQGGYMFQANGMTPYLGQVAAAGAYSSFAAGNRMGLISPEQLARMGGLEGATQASLTGQINVSQTMFNKMALYNQYMGGGRGAYGANGTTVGTLNNFGSNMAADPMGTYGAMMLHGNQMAGKQVSERGSLAVDDQLALVAKDMPWLLDKNGKISLEKATPLLMHMGMSIDQIQAYGAQRFSETDPATQAQNMRAMNKFYQEQQRQYISQTGTYGGVFGSSIHATRQGLHGITDAISDNLVTPVTDAIGWTHDAAGSISDKVQFGSTVKGGDTSTIDQLLGKVPEAAKTALNKDSMSFYDTKSLLTYSAKYAGDGSNKYGDLKTAAEDVNEVQRRALKGDKAALEAMSEKNPKEKARKIMKLLRSGDYGKDIARRFSTLEGTEGVEEMLTQVSTVSGSDKQFQPNWLEKMIGSNGKAAAAAGPDLTSAQQFTKDLQVDSSMKTGDMVDQVHTIGLSAMINSRFGSTGKDGLNLDNIEEMAKSDKDIQELMKLTGAKSGRDLLKIARDNVANARHDGTLMFGVASLKYKGKDALTDTAKSLGGQVYEDKISNALDLNDEENRGGSALSIQQAKLKQEQVAKFQQGIVDVSQSQSTQNSLDMGKAVDKFDKAVDRFVGKANTPDGVSNDAATGTTGQPDNLSAWDRFKQRLASGK